MTSISSDGDASSNPKELLLLLKTESSVANEVETLGPVAELQVSIIKAKDLACRELSHLFQPTCNAYCKATLSGSLLDVTGLFG